MNTRHRTCYRKGDQLLNSYGARTNRFLITNYGFALRQNKYNYLGIKVFVNYDNDQNGQNNQQQKVLKLKHNKLAEDLLQYLRANLIFLYRKNNGSVQNNYCQDLLVSSPVNFDFEIYILKQGISLVTNLLDKFPTTIQEDMNILAQKNVSWRLQLAVTHRITQKECLTSQAKLLEQLLSIVEDAKESKSIKQAYLK